MAETNHGRGQVAMAAVRLDGMLRSYAAQGSLTEEARDVRQLLDTLETRFPRLRFRLRDETGVVRQHVRIFVNGEEIAHLAGLDTALGTRDQVDILHSIQGG